MPARALLAALLLAGCAAPNTEQACRIVKLAEVPLLRAGNRPVVELTILGKPARFLLDTGATGLLITDAAFQRLGLRYDLRIIANSTSVGAQSLSRVTEPPDLRLGAFELEPQRLVVVPSATDLTPQSGLEGLLGTRVLAAYDLDLDMPRNRLVLNKPRRCPLGPPPIEGPSITFQVAPNPRNYMHVPVRVDGRDLSLLLDSGASRTYLNEERIGLSSTDTRGDRALSIHSAGPAAVSSQLHRFARFELGQEVHRNPAFIVGPLKLGEDGLLGADFLRGHRAWLSFAGWAVTIQQRGGDQR